MSDTDLIERTWTCAAKAQGTPGGNDPADCDWPFCGCDPHADNVLAAIGEAGNTIVPDARLTALEAENAELRRERDEARAEKDRYVETAERLFDDRQLMPDTPETATAAENVLIWLLIEKARASDEDTYSAREAQDIIARRLDEGDEAECRAEAAEAEVARLKAPLEGMQTTAEERERWRSLHRGIVPATRSPALLSDLDHALAAARLAGEEEREATNFLDKHGRMIRLGDVVRRPVRINQELHGEWGDYEIRKAPGGYLFSYLRSEKGNILPVGYTGGYMADTLDDEDETDIKTLVFTKVPIRLHAAEIVTAAIRARKENPDETD